MIPERFDWLPRRRSWWEANVFFTPAAIGGTTTIQNWVAHGKPPIPWAAAFYLAMPILGLLYLRRPAPPAYELLADDDGLLLRPPPPIPFWRRPLFGTAPDGWRVAWADLRRVRRAPSYHGVPGESLIFEAADGSPRLLRLTDPAGGAVGDPDRLLALLARKGYPVAAEPE